MENEEFVQQAAEYLDKLPLKKFTNNSVGVTYWRMPEADESEWIACITSDSKDTVSIITKVKVEEHPRLGAVILTRFAFSVHDYMSFKNKIDTIMKDCERAQRKFYSKLKKWKAVQIKDCAKNFEV